MKNLALFNRKHCNIRGIVRQGRGKRKPPDHSSGFIYSTIDLWVIGAAEKIINTDMVKICKFHKCIRGRDTFPGFIF